MYSSCLYCSRSLGSNALIEALPTGRRVAFDARVGRLWVVCTECARWNLVPFDSRLEAIDSCEQLFRDTRTRYSTDNIGLAHHRAGVDLIRIGPALRPEFAAWRYGSAVRQRRRPASGQGADPIGALNWIITSLSGGPLASLPFRDVTAGAMRALRHHRVLRDPWTGQLVQVPYVALMQATLSTTDAGEWRLDVPYRTGAERSLYVDGSTLPSIRDVPTLGIFTGAEVLPTLGRLLPAMEAHMPGDAIVGEAVRLIETAPTRDRLMAYVAGQPLRFVTQRHFPVRDVAGEVRLALEMLAHEDTEQRVMEGELRLLERQWQDAETVARLADGLALDSPSPAA
ncbi:MAG TPA: hypothetical protein VGM77_13275 [Gemmatimonadales bacterium]|jgi:hypothetical protein